MFYRKKEVFIDFKDYIIRVPELESDPLISSGISQWVNRNERKFKIRLADASIAEFPLNLKWPKGSNLFIESDFDDLPPIETQHLQLIGDSQINRFSNHPLRPHFELVRRAPEMTKADAGPEHGLAIDSYNKAWSWGDSSEGKLGQPGYQEDGNPLPLSDAFFNKQYLNDAKEVIALENHSLIKRLDGSWWFAGQRVIPNGTHIQGNGHVYCLMFPDKDFVLINFIETGDSLERGWVKKVLPVSENWSVLGLINTHFDVAWHSDIVTGNISIFDVGESVTGSITGAVGVVVGGDLTSTAVSGKSHLIIDNRLGIFQDGDLLLSTPITGGASIQRGECDNFSFHHGTFCLIGYDSDIAVISEDGENWSQVSLPVSGKWISCTNSRDYFLVLSEEGYIIRTKDGVSWSLVTTLDYNHPEKTLEYCNQQIGESFSVGDFVTGEISNAIGQVVDIIPDEAILDFDGIPPTRVLYFKNLEYARLHYNNIQSSGYKRLYYSNLQTSQNFSFNDSVTGETSNAIGSIVEVDRVNNFITFSDIFNSPFQDGERLIVGPNYIADADGPETDILKFFSVGDVISGAVSGSDAIVEYAYNFSETDGVLYLKFFTDTFQNGEPLLTENGYVSDVDDSDGGAFDFVVGDFITGKVSAASAEIVESYSLGPIGWLTLQNIKGEFVDNEYLVRNNDGFEFVKADETLIDVPLFVEGSNLKGAISGAHGKITQVLHIGKLFVKGFYSDIILNYDNLQLGKSFSKGDIIYGETSRSTAEILSDESGYLYLYDVHGDFIDSERLIVNDIYIADVNGLINSSERSFSEGDCVLGIISAATGIVDQVFSDYILLKEVHGDYEDDEHLVVNEQFIALVDGRLLVASGSLSLTSVSESFIDDEHLEVKYVYTADANGDMRPLTGELTLGGVTGTFQNGERLLAPNYIADVDDELVDWPREVTWKSIVAKGDLVCTFASNSMIFGRSIDQGSSFVKSELPFHLDWSCAVGCWPVTESSADPDDRYIILVAQQSREFLRSKDGISWSMFSLSSEGGSLYFENLQYRDFGNSIKSETYLSDESVHAFAAIRKITESVENPYNGILDIGIYRDTEDPLEWDYNGDDFLRNVRFINEEGLYSYWLGSYQEIADVDGSMYDIKARLIVTGFTRGTGIIYHDGIEACIGYDNLQGGQEFFDGDIVTGETSGVQAEIRFVDSVNSNLYLINLYHPETRTFMESFEDNEKLTVDGVYIADANSDMSRDIFNLNEVIIQCREDGHQVYIWDHENRERLEFRSVSNVNLILLKDQKIRGKSSGAVATVKETWISSNYGSAVLTYQNLKDDVAILHFDYLDYGEHFNIDDVITGQISGASATVRSLNETEKIIAVDLISGNFIYGEKLVVNGTVTAKSDSTLKYGFQEGVKITGQDSGSLAEIIRNTEDSETSGELQLIYNRGCFDWSESVGEHLAVGGIPGLYIADSTSQRIRDARGIFVIEQRIGSFVQDEEIVVVSFDTGEDEYSLGTVERLSKGSFGILFYDEAPYLYPNPGLTATKYIKYKNLQPGKIFSLGQSVRGVTSGMTGTIIAVSAYAQTIVVSSDSPDTLFFINDEWLVVSSQNYAQADGAAVNWMGNVLKYSNLQSGKSFSIGDVVTGSTSNVKVSIDDVINSDHLNGGVLLLNDFRDFIESEQMLVSGQHIANIHKEEQDYSSPFWNRGTQLLIKGSLIGTNPDIPFCKPLVKGPVHFPVFSLYDKVVGETSGSQGVILQGDYIQNVVDPLFEIGENLLVDGKIRCNFALYDWVSGKLRFKNKKGRKFFASDAITGSFSGSTALIENVGDFDNPVNLKEGYQYYYDLQEIGRFNFTNLQEGKSFNENDWVFGETSKTIAQVKYVHNFNDIQFLIISDFIRDHIVYENLQSGKIFNEGDVIIGEDSGSKAIASLVFSEYDVIGLSCFYGVFQEGERLLVNGLYIADFSVFHSGVDFTSSERILVSSEYIADSYSLVQYGFNSGDCIEAESSLTDWGQYSSFAKFLDHTILFSDYYIHDEPGESFGPEAELLYSDMVIGDTFKRRQVIYGSWSGAFGTISKNYPSVGYIHYSDLDTGYSFNVGDNIVCSISGAKGIILKDTPYAKLEYSNLQGDPEDSPDVIFSELDIVTGKISGARGEVATLVEVPSFNKLGYKDLQSFNGDYLGLGCYAYNNISSTVKDLLTGGVYFDIVRMIPNTGTEGIFYLKDQPNEIIPDNYYIFIIDGTKNKYTRRIAQVNGDSIYAPEKGYLYLKDVEGSFQNGEELRVLKDAILFDNIQPGKTIYPRDLISGGTSGATATIIQVEDDVLFLKDIWGTFENSEQLLVKDHRFPNSLFDYCADTNSVIFTGNLYTADSSSLPVTGNSGCLELGNIELGTTVEYSRRIEDSDQDFITGDCLIGKISGVTAKIDKIVPYSFMGCKNIGLIYKFNEKDFISGELSGATAIVNSIYDDPHDQQRATLKLTDVDGIFTDNEEIIVNNIPIATVDKGISSNLLFRQMVGAKIRYTDKVRSKTFVVGTTYYDLHSGAQGTVRYKESISSTEGFLIVDGLIGIFRGPIVDISLQLFANTSSMDWCFDIGDSIAGKTSGTTATVNCRSTDWSHSGIVCGLYNFYNATPNSLIRFIDQEKNSGFEYAPGFFNITEDGVINGLDYYTTITGLTNVHLIRSGVVGNYFGSDRNWEISNPEIWGKNEDEEYECSFSVKTGLLGVTDISGPGFQDGEIIQVHGIDLALVDGVLRMPAGHLVLSQLESYKKNDGFEFAEWLNLIRIGYSTLQSGKSFSPGDIIQGFNSLATAIVNSVYPQDSYRGYLNISSLKGQFQSSEPIYVNDELYAYTFGSSYESSVAASASEIDLDNDFFHGESININNDCKAKVLNKSQFHKGKLYLKECKGSFLQDEPLTSDIGILTFDSYQGTPFRTGSSIYGFSSHSTAEIFKIDLNVAQKTGRLHLREIMGAFIDGEEIHSQGIFKGYVNGIVDYVDRADVADVDNRYFRYTSGTMHCQDFVGFVDEEFRPDWLLVHGIRFAKISDDPDFYFGLKLDLINISGEFQDQEWLEVDGIFIASAKRFIHNVEYETHRGILSYTGNAVQSNDNYDTQDWVDIDYSSEGGIVLISNQSDCNYGNLNIYKVQAHRRFFKGDIIIGEDSDTQAEVLGYQDGPDGDDAIVIRMISDTDFTPRERLLVNGDYIANVYDAELDPIYVNGPVDFLLIDNGVVTGGIEGSSWAKSDIEESHYSSVSFLDFESSSYQLCTPDETDYDAIISQPLDWLPGLDQLQPLLLQGWPSFEGLQDFQHISGLDTDVALTVTGSVWLRGSKVAGWAGLAHNNLNFVAVGYNSNVVAVGYFESIIETKYELKLSERAPGQWLEIGDVVIGRQSDAIGTVETEPYDKNNILDHYDWVDLAFGSVTGDFEVDEKITVDNTVYGTVESWLIDENFPKLKDYDIFYYSLPSKAEWIGVAWNGSVYCTIARNSNKAATSPDGTLWTARILPANYDWTKIVAHGSIFVAFAYNTNVFAYSINNGENWNTGTLPVVGQWSAIASNGITLVAFSEGSTLAICSEDLSSWICSAMPFVGFWSDAIWDGIVFCVVALDDPYVVTSTNGSSWMKSGSLRFIDGASSITTYDGYLFVEYFISEDHGVTWNYIKDNWTDVAMGITLMGCYPRIVDPLDDKKNSLTFLHFNGTIRTTSLYEYKNSSIDIEWRTNSGLQNLGESSDEWEELAGITGVVRIATGSNHLLLLKNDGTVWSWGDNEYGQLGLNRFDDSIFVNEIRSLSHVEIVDIYCHDNRSFAIQSNGAVWAWGDNNQGLLGLAPSLWPIRAPREVLFLQDAYIIESDFFIKSDGTIWSLSERKQLWSFIGNCVNVSQGNDYTLFLNDENTLWSFGDNENGKLGVGREEEFELEIPWQTFGSKTVSKYICPRYSAFVLENGEVWSKDNFIYRGTDAIQVMPYTDGSLILKEDGSVWCRTPGDGLLYTEGALLFGPQGKGLAYNLLADEWRLIDIPEDFNGSASAFNVQIAVIEGTTDKIKVTRDGRYWDEVQLPTSGNWVIAMRPTTDRLSHGDYDEAYYPYFPPYYDWWEYDYIVPEPKQDHSKVQNFNLREQANGPFVLMARGQPTVLYSTDGYNWNWYYIQFTDNWKTVKHFVELASQEYVHQEGNLRHSEFNAQWSETLRSRWIALVDGDVDYFYESFDLKNWTKRYLPFSAEWQDVAFVRTFSVAKRKELTETYDSLYSDWITVVVEDRGRYLFLPKEIDKVVYFEHKVLGFDSGSKCPTYGDGVDECRWQKYIFFEPALGYDDIDENVFFEVNLPIRPLGSYWKSIESSTCETYHETYETVVAVLPSLGNIILISRGGNTQYVECTLPLDASEWDGVWFWKISAWSWLTNPHYYQGQIEIDGHEDPVAILYYKNLPSGKHWDDTDILWSSTDMMCCDYLICVDSNDVYNEEESIWYDPQEQDRGYLSYPNYDFCEYTFVCSNSDLLWENPSDLTKGFIAGDLINFFHYYPTKFERYFLIDVDTDLYAWYSIWVSPPGYYSRAVWFSCKADSPVLKTYAAFVIISTKDKKAYVSNADKWPTGYPTLDSWTEIDLPDGVQSYSFTNLIHFPDTGIFSILRNNSINERELQEFRNISQLSYIQGGKTTNLGEPQYLFDESQYFVPMVLKSDGTIWYWTPYEEVPKQLEGITGVVHIGGMERQELINLRADIEIDKPTYYCRYNNLQIDIDYFSGDYYGEDSNVLIHINGVASEGIESSYISGYISFCYLEDPHDELIVGEKLRKVITHVYAADVTNPPLNIFKRGSRIGRNSYDYDNFGFCEIEEIIDETHFKVQYLRGSVYITDSGTMYVKNTGLFVIETGSKPVLPTGSYTDTSIDCYHYYDRYFALKNDGTVWTWTIDRGTFDIHDSPVQFRNIEDAVELYVGPPNVFIKSDRSLWYFRGSDFEIGEYVSKVPDLPPVKAVAVGGSAYYWNDEYNQWVEEPTHRVQGFAIDYEGRVYKFRDFFNHVYCRDEWNLFKDLFYAKQNSLNFSRDIDSIVNVGDYWYYTISDGKIISFLKDETEDHIYASDLCDVRYYYPFGSLIITIDLSSVGIIGSTYSIGMSGFGTDYSQISNFIRLSFDKGLTWTSWNSHMDFDSILLEGMEVHNAIMQLKAELAIDPLDWTKSPVVDFFRIYITSLDEG